MAIKMKKPWGLNGHPRLPSRHWDMDLWVTLTKIKIKEAKVKHIIFSS